MTFKEVAILSARPAVADVLGGFTREEKQTRLKASVDTAHPAIIGLAERFKQNNPKAVKPQNIVAGVKRAMRRGKAKDTAPEPTKIVMPASVNMMIGPAMLGIVIGNDTDHTKLMVYRDQLPEWDDFFDEHFDFLKSKSVEQAQRFLTSSFTDADAAHLRGGSIAIAAKLGEVVGDTIGFQIGAGPGDITSIKVYEKIARGMFMHTYDVTELMGSIDVTFAEDKEKDAGRRPADPAPLDMQPIVF